MEPERWEEKPGSVGRPLDNLTGPIADEQGNDLPAGQVGELLVKGPSICSGYLNDPEETRRVFSTVGCEPATWLARMRRVICGSKDAKGAFLKMRGMRVSFAEVEEQSRRDSRRV